MKSLRLGPLIIIQSDFYIYFQQGAASQIFLQCVSPLLIIVLRDNLPVIIHFKAIWLVLKNTMYS